MNTRQLSDRIHALVTAKMVAEPALDYGEATKRVLSERPNLATTYGARTVGHAAAEPDDDGADGVRCARCGESLSGGTRGDSHPDSVQCKSCGALNDLSDLELAQLDAEEAGGGDAMDDRREVPSDAGDADHMKPHSVASRDQDGAPARVQLSLAEQKRFTATYERARKRGGWV